MPPAATPATLLPLLMACAIALASAAQAIAAPAGAADAAGTAPPTAAPPPAPGKADPAPTPDFEKGPAPQRVMPADPVLLQRGSVVPGARSIFVDWEGNRYLFESEATREVFRNDPKSFAAADGGACGRMGPLGGLGDARRYAIEEGLLYFFASDGCMERFRKEPHRYMEPYDLLPSGSPEQQTAGLAAFARWVSWCGGKDAVVAAERYAQVKSSEVTSGGRRWSLEENVQVDGPRTMRRTDTWRPIGDPPAAAITFAVETTPDAAVVVDGAGGRVPLVASRRKAFERWVNRAPYCILRARYRPEAGFMAIKTGEGPINGTDCDFVLTWFGGNSTHLAIAKSTGELVQMSYIGRDEESRVGTLTMNVLRSGEASALRLPVQWAVFREGQTETQPGPDLSIRIEKSPAPPAAPAAPAAQQAPAAP